MVEIGYVLRYWDGRALMFYILYMPLLFGERRTSSNVQLVNLQSFLSLPYSHLEREIDTAEV